MLRAKDEVFADFVFFYFLPESPEAEELSVETIADGDLVILRDVVREH